MLVAGGLLVAGVAMSLLNAPKPNFADMLDQAEHKLKDEHVAEALEQLNKEIAPYVAAEDLPRELVQRFHVLRARAVYIGEAKNDHSQANGNEGHAAPAEDRLGAPAHAEAGGGAGHGASAPAHAASAGHGKATDPGAANAEQIVSEYLQAERAGMTLAPEDVWFLADTYIRQGEFDRAMARRASLPEDEGERKSRIIRRIVDRKLSDRRTDYETTLELISEYLSDPMLEDADRAWALSRQGELLMRQGFVDRAITILVQGMIRFRDVDPELLGELHFVLGRAYVDAGAMQDAYTQLTQAEQILSEGDPRRAEVLVMLARLEGARGESETSGQAEAVRLYEQVLREFETTPSALPALMGLGEAAASRLELDQALEHYHRLIELLKKGRSHHEVTSDDVAHGLLAHARERYEAGDVAAALQYAWVAESVPGTSVEKAEVDLMVARCRRAQADTMLKDLDQAESAQGRIVSLAQLDPATREEARRYFIEAGKAFREHADAVSLKDNAAFGDSLWLAADSYDRAGDQESAIPLFNQFLKGFSGDPRLAEASFRLAQAYQAKGDYDMAARYYQGIIRAASGDALDPGAAAYGDLSLVPLAQTFLMDGNPTNDDQAEQLLEQVIDGKIGGPETAQYRSALMELATRKLSRQDYPRAIELLEEALVRADQTPDSDRVRYDLADAHRRAATTVRTQLAEALPDHQRQTLTRSLSSHLRRSMELFEQTRVSLATRDERRLGELERLRGRNAGFFAADCAYELGDYQTAIQLYEAARERHPTDPASLVSMVQVVNAYLKLGDTRRAQVANERARRFYESLPAETWADPNLPMSQEHWKAWLDANSTLMQTASAEGGGEEGGTR